MKLHGKIHLQLLLIMAMEIKKNEEDLRKSSKDKENCRSKYKWVKKEYLKKKIRKEKNETFYKERKDNMTFADLQKMSIPNYTVYQQFINN